jgi:5-(carboxyamino)imidazole ribonucleotide synthase
VNSKLVEPGSVLGVLGGGQLGAMFAQAATRLHYPVAVWDPDPDAPAHRLAAHSFPSLFTDQQAFTQFAALVSVVTYEWENVPAELCERLERTKPVRPASSVLQRIQNRLVQKSFLAGQGFPVPRFAALTEPDRLPDVLEELGYPAVCKTATAGYDGKGQWKIDEPSSLSSVKESLLASSHSGMEWIVESFVPFERELSILVARGIDGQTIVYPLVENVHETGILRMTVVPAQVPSSVVERSADLARAVVARMDGIGLFCLELFLLSDQRVLINEVAPRPHNSGHYTLDACNVSQFEQQVRAITGLPPQEVQLTNPAAMVNLIGQDSETVKRDVECRRLLGLPGAYMHEYGKRAIRPRRKMGHVTFLAHDVETARDRASRLRQSLLHARRIN